MQGESNILSEVESCALRGEWGAVIDRSSQAIFDGCSPYYCIYFYRYWIDALVQSKDFFGCQDLAKHLLKYRKDFPQFVPLALISLSQCGRLDLAGKVAKSIRIKNTLEQEAMAIYLTEQPNAQHRKQGVTSLFRLAQKQFKYLPLQLSALNAALENECYSIASALYQTLNEHFPTCAEPYWAAARIAIGEGRWADAAKMIEEILFDNPSNQDAIVVAAKCFEFCGDYKVAVDLLQSSEFLFEEFDLDFNLALGFASYKLWQRYSDNESKELAVKHLWRASVCLEKMAQPMAEVELALARLENAGRDVENQTPQIWILGMNRPTLQSLLEGSTELFRAPAEIKQGDYVFLSKSKSIVGLLKAQSHQIVDGQFGKAIQLGHLKIFEQDCALNHDKMFDKVTEIGFTLLDEDESLKLVDMIESSTNIELFGDRDAV